MDYDILVVGAGIAGLYTALQYLKKYPDTRVAIIEKYKTVGGRAYTFRTKLDARGPIHWEAGTGRIHKTHKLTMGLLHNYGLEVGPIGSNTMFKESYKSPLEPNKFDSVRLLNFLKYTKPLPNLGSMTFYEALQKAFKQDKLNNILKEFPYWSEVFTMRADIAIRSFEHEMGTGSNYFYPKDGFSALIKEITKDILGRGGKIYTGVECLGWNRVSPEKYRTFCKIGEKHLQYFAEKIVFAIPSVALQKLPAFKEWPLLKHLKMEPLLRCYAVFPKNTHGVAWCHDIPRFVTATPLRYFIPINPKEGIMMISYTDGDDARHWMNILNGPAGEYKVRRKILAEIRAHFPERTIPDPLFFKTHPWSDGCTYWTPGQYDPFKASKEALRPFENREKIFVCGESFSMRQAWIEGALEHAESLLTIL